jgi:sugar-specific transcriptional regulator TrmB
MNIEVLQKIGLTNNEAKVYVALLETGSTTTGAIIKKTGLFGARVYESLNKLIMKGFVRFVVISNKKYFESVNPNILLESLKEKEEELNLILPELRLKQQSATITQSAIIYQGIKGLKSALKNMLNELSKKERYYVFASGLMHSTLEAYYEEFQKKKEKKKIYPSIIYDISIKKKSELLEKTYGKPRFYNIKEASPTDTFIYNDKVLLIIWRASPPFAVLITSQDLADSYKAYFNVIWKKASE